MVLPLKRWKSRSSPGIAAGAHDNIEDLEEPIYNSKGGQLSLTRRRPPFFVLIDCRFGIDLLVARDGAAR